MKPWSAAWRFGVSGVIAAVLLILVANVIRHPVAAQTRSYIAEFTDASGLHQGADVRVRGVRMGKVSDIDLVRRDGRSIAMVGLTLDKRYGIVPATKLAIKYQALTGLRYVEIVNPAEHYLVADLTTRIPASMTLPSYDITKLFNGLQPVLATLSPEELNTFTANAEAYLAGNGEGLGPMLDSIRKLTEYVSNREEMLQTLLSNLAAVGESLGGHSKDMVQILDWVHRWPVDEALTVLDEFRKSALYGPNFTEALARLLANVGFTEHAELDTALDRAFSNLDDAMEAFKLVPVMWDNIEAPGTVGTPAPCSQGRAELPGPMDVLLNGRKVVLCNR